MTNEHDEEEREDVDVAGAIWKEVKFEELEDGNDAGHDEIMREHPQWKKDVVHKTFIDSRSDTQYPRLVIEIRHSGNEEFFGPSFDIHTSSKFAEEDWWSDQLHFPMSLLPEVMKMMEQFQKNVNSHV